MRFEWDTRKRASNLIKHGVDFFDAARVIADSPLMSEDARRDYGETRCLAYGQVDGRILVVAFVLRDGVFRIISARKANARERRMYAEQG